MDGGNFVHDNMPAPKSDLVMPLFSLKGRTAIVSGGKFRYANPDYVDSPSPALCHTPIPNPTSSRTEYLPWDIRENSEEKGILGVAQRRTLRAKLAITKWEGGC